MASLTKEELRQALVSHGVTDLPPTSAKKDELIALYEEHVAPTANGSADFSSDDEVDFKSSPSKRASTASKASKVSSVSKASKVSKSSSKSPKKNAENVLVVDDLDISALDDDELFEKLKENGIDVGPIVASTRPLYMKKLAMVLRGESMNGTNGNGVGYSDTEEEEEEEVEEPVIETRVTRRSASSKNSSTSQSPKVSPIKSPVTSMLSNLSGLRQRQTAADEADTSGKLTPTPRRSIHSYKVSETTKTTITKNRDGTETKNVFHNVERSEDNKTEGGKSWSRPVVNLIKFLLLVVILVGVYFVVISQMESTGSMSQIEEIEEAVNKAQESAPPPPVREDVEAGNIGNV